MFWIGYRFIIFLFQIAVAIKSIWNEKASMFLYGRIDHIEKISSWLKANDEPLIQIHCASLGEFELSLPLYYSLKSKYPNHKFLFSFFSPSGYEYAKLPLGTQRSYLPIDRKRLVKDFIKHTNPKLVIFIKYEFWFNYLDELSKNKIPYGFVNINQQTITKNLKFRVAKELINNAKFVCTSNKVSTLVLKNNDLKCSGQFIDLRYSQSLQIQNEKYKIEKEIELFISQVPTVICGSIWKEDMENIKQAINKYDNLHWVIAPHEISDSMLNYLEENFAPLSYFSDGKIKNDSRVLIIDTIGDLKYLYKYGQLNYVGGAFKTGLHNVIEPLYAGTLIVFGPLYDNFPEAKYLIKNGLAKSIKNEKEFNSIIENLNEGSLHLESPINLQRIKEDLSHLSALVTQAYESRS